MRELTDTERDLSPEEKRRVLASLLKEKMQQEVVTAPMSHGQRALWFMYELDRRSAAYNIMYAARVRADLDREAFCRAFQTLIGRHPVLRTTYAMRGGFARQEVHPHVKFELQAIDAGAFSWEELQQQIQSTADVPFDLTHGPVIRVHLFERTDEQHVLLFTAHHISLDFWSFDLLFDELEALYRQETTGTAAELTSPKADYTDFVRWQEAMLEGDEGARLFEYWQQRLHGHLPNLELPVDRPRPPLQSFAGKSFHFNLPDELATQLIELSTAHGATLYATLLAAFQVLLYRYSGQRDILVGSPTAGRNRAEFEEILGYFLNPIVLRAQLAPDEPFLTFLDQVRETLIGGIAHQDYPFAHLVERLQPPRDASRSPVFHVAFGWDKPRKLSQDVGGNSTFDVPVDPGTLALEPFALGQQGAAFDLMLMMLNLGRSVSAALQYNSDLFDESTIVRMVGHFQTLLAGIVSDPRRQLADLPLLSRAEQRVLIEDWNDTSADYPRERCLHQLFESQATRTPDRIAVEDDGARLTYRQLDERSNQLGQYLVKRGVGTDVSVGICMLRSVDMLVAILGVLKAGGAYVPLAPGTPGERLSYMLDESRAAVLLTQQELAGELQPFTDQIVCLDDDWPRIDEEPIVPPECSVEPSNLAYVIFTSGSTGKPKGVQIEHRTVVNFLVSMQNEPGMTGDDVLLAVTTLTFDISVLELLLPIITGAKVVVVCGGVAADGMKLQDILSSSGATVMQATPATWRLLVEADWQGDERLKILCGGEALPRDLADQLIGRCASLWNMYGPTETTIWSAVDQVQNEEGPVLIGRPVANTQIYVLDDRLRPVPMGVTGDLYIGGDGLARGYLNQPELTAEKFIDDPFRVDQEGRLYKTGDLARFVEDGRIEFLGRSDFQVKVRGFRIELGEIESHLVGHPSVRQAAVTAHQTGPHLDDKQLVAYLTTDGEAPTTSDLRDFLKLTLPDYMVPSQFVPLDRFPLNAAGKVDRKALPAPDTARPELRVVYVAPRNATEEALADIWASVLGLDEVGIHDNFFELGGASIQSLEIATRATEEGVQITPTALFRYPTIAELAESGVEIADAVGGHVAESMPVAVEPAMRIEAVADTVTEPQQTAEVKTEKSNIFIESLGVYLPEKSLTTKEVLAGCKKKVWFPLEYMTGIKSRRTSDDSECTLDLAEKAVAECLANSQYGADEIDLILCCHIGRAASANAAAVEPSTSLMVKRRFGFPNAVAFDITNACAGMFTGISIVESFIQNGAIRRGMVVSGEYLSSVLSTAQLEITEFMDPRIACLTLGDAGAAVILDGAPDNSSGFHELEMYTLSKYSQMCIGKLTEEPHGGPILLVPDPIKHTTVAVQNSVAHAKHVFERSPWEPEKMQHLIMHQTSERSLLDGARSINKSFGRKVCTSDNMINNVSERGNTASTSHFVALWDNILNGRINSGDRVVFGITGSGQTIGTAIYTLDDLPDRVRKRKATADPVGKTGVAQTQAPLVHRRQRPIVRIAAVGVAPPGMTGPVETMPWVKAAAEECLAQSGYQRTDIGLLLFAGMYRTDFISEPAMAAMIAGELQINDEILPHDAKQTLAFDVYNGSVGFLNACHVASEMIRAGKFSTAMLIASEVENNRADWPDELIGLKETASAMILDDTGQGRSGFGQFVFKYLTEHQDAFTVGGYYRDGRPFVLVDRQSDVGNLYLGIIPDAVQELLDREGLDRSEIKVVLPPQFSASFLSDLSGALNLPRNDFVDLTEDRQDLYSSALPYSIYSLQQQNLVGSGDVGLIISVGSGLQVGCATYYF